MAGAYMSFDGDKKDWLENLEERLFKELDQTTNPKRAVKIIETICTGRTNISNNGYDHDNTIPDDIAMRIINSPSPVLAEYRARLSRWGADYRYYPPLPTLEWLMEMIRDS